MTALQRGRAALGALATTFVAAALVTAVAATALLSGCAPAPAPPAPEDVAARAVAQLSDGLSLGRFTAVLGRVADISRPAGTLVEKLWIDDTVAVQALVGPADEVLGYSVTTRSDRFHPPVPLTDGGVLGRTPLDRYPGFTDPPLLTAALGGLGVHGNWYYTEAAPAIGATRNRSLVLTASDASRVGVPDGLGDDLTALGEPTGQPVGPFHQAETAPHTVPARAHLVPTTYSVLNPKLDPGTLPPDLRFGPTDDDVLAVLPVR